MQRCHTYKIAVSKYQGRCEQRSEVFVKTFILFYFLFFWGGGGGGGSGRGGGHRVDVNKVFVKIKKSGRVGGGGGGVRVDVNEELKFL